MGNNLFRSRVSTHPDRLLSNAECLKLRGNGATQRLVGTVHFSKCYEDWNTAVSHLTSLLEAKSSS